MKCYTEPQICSFLKGSFERGNETSSSIRDGEFIDQLSEYQLLKKDSGPWS
jgi:hypothetical protein